MSYPPVPPQQQFAPQVPQAPAAPPTAPAAPGMPPSPPPPQAAASTSVNFLDLIKASQDAGFVLYPAGWYDAVVDSAEAGTTSTGKPVIKVKFRIVTGPYAGRGMIRNQFVITADNPNALSFFFQHMEALGLPQQYFAQGPTLPQVAQALVGRACRVRLSDDRVYNNRPQNDVQEILPANTGFSQVPGPTQPGTPQFAAPVPVPVPPATPGTVTFNYEAPAPAAQPQPAAPAAPQPPQQPVAPAQPDPWANQNVAQTPPQAPPTPPAQMPQVPFNGQPGQAPQQAATPLPALPGAPAQQPQAPAAPQRQFSHQGASVPGEQASPGAAAPPPPPTPPAF